MQISFNSEDEVKHDSVGIVQSETLASSLVQTAVNLGHSVAEPVACVCTCSLQDESIVRKKSRSGRLKKTLALYLTMVAVSTLAIFWLEHASIFGAFRTALVAAVGKTVAASWVTSFFE